jgi:polyphosphate glucokinase
MAEPHNLGSGWVGFDYAKAFGRPVRIINDAAMQALGSYRGGKLLFLGLGTGLGTTLVIDGAVEAMEIAHLPYRKATFEAYVGRRALDRFGKKKWRRHVLDIVERLTAAFEPDDIVLGGGNAKLLKELPPRSRLGDNANAFVGGFRLWADAPRPAAAGGKRARKAPAKKAPVRKRRPPATKHSPAAAPKRKTRRARARKRAA